MENISLYFQQAVAPPRRRSGLEVLCLGTLSNVQYQRHPLCVGISRSRGSNSVMLLLLGGLSRGAEVKLC